MALAFLRPGPPHAQLVGDLQTAKSAIFVGVLNGRSWYRLYLLAKYLTAVLGVVLLAAGMTVSAPTVAASPVWERVLKRVAWAAKVLTGGTLQFTLTVFHSCLGLSYTWLEVSFVSLHLARVSSRS
ncbi:hypothetical protein BS78_07G157600 [Paspalum vaginatum]|nr:hypothetical protein BS78_07G157600 [Paspalum vaginatum]